MNDSFIIPDDIFDIDLLCFLDVNRFDDRLTKENAQLLHKICLCNICDFGNQIHIENLALTDDELDTIIANDWENSSNIEIKARCSDVLKRRSKDKREIVIKASDAYMEVFHRTQEMEYLERAVSIRNFKQVNNDDFLTVILKEISVKTIKYPYWLGEIVTLLLKSYPAGKLSNITGEIQNQIQKANDSKGFHTGRGYYDVLFLLGSITQQELHKLKALNFEAEGDNVWNNQVENTFYPTLPEYYEKAYKEIYAIKSTEPAICERIRKKLIDAKKYFVGFLTTVGIPCRQSLPDKEQKKIEKWVANEKWSSPADFIVFLINVPFTSKEIVEKYMETSRKASPMPSMLGSSRVNEDGNTMGVGDPENSLRTEAHMYFRQKILYTLWLSLEKAHNMQLYIDEKLLFYLLKKQRPSFLYDDDRLHFWLKGLMAGFNNDFMTASHILVPQVENALREIAEKYHGSLVKFERDKQDEALLGTIMEQLKNVIIEEIRFEIGSFLQSGIDVNFRNILSHGLISSFEITQYGIYLWWMAIKLFFGADKIIIPSAITETIA